MSRATQAQTQAVDSRVCALNFSALLALPGPQAVGI